MYVCRKMRMCSFLLKNGFQYETERADRNDPKRRVWLFKSSPELYNAIEEYYSLIQTDNK